MLWKATCEVSEERGRVKECESDRTREISGQNKVFVQDMLKNAGTSSAIDANTYHTVIAVCMCIAYQFYGKSDKMV